MTTNIERFRTFKIVVIGDSNVGKSSLITRSVHDIFHTEYYATIGVDVQIAIINIGDYKCRLQIWDTAGQERFRSITSSYYRIAGGIIIVYDVTNSASFAQIKVQISEMENYCDETIPKILVGNKDDNNNEINKVISTRNVCEYAEENHLTFYETSVKDNKNITEVFNEIARLALERYLGNSLNKVSGILIEQSQTIENVTNKKCCTA